MAVSLAECLVLWFCVSLLCDRHRPRLASTHTALVSQSLVGLCFAFPSINQSLCIYQAQRMTPGKRSRASTTAAGRRAAPNHGGRAAAARNLRHNANRARPSTGKHTPRLGRGVPRARERGWLLAREGSFRDPLHDHARIIPRPGGRRDCNQSSRAACRSLGRLGRRGGEQGTQL